VIHEQSLGCGRIQHKKGQRVHKLLVPSLGVLALLAASVGGPGEIDLLPSSKDTRAAAMAEVAPLASSSRCHTSYDPCIPDGPDLDCPEIGHRVEVIGPDEYRLNADPHRDDEGCDNYPVKTN
jgi:hypothetical protein